MADPINPPHYRAGGMESIDIIETYRLGFAVGNAVKYLLRAGRKSDDPRQDLEKARWYVQRAGARPRYDLQFAPASENAHVPAEVIIAFGLTGHRAEAVYCLLQERLDRADVLKAEHYIAAAIRECGT
jgi:hypothetical protein